jgi:hypothetical protein
MTTEALQSAESAASLVATSIENEASRRATAAQVAELLKQAVAVWHGKPSPVHEEPQTPAEYLSAPSAPTTTSVGQSKRPNRRVLTGPQPGSELRGPRTQEYDFHIPILEALVSLGGEAPTRKVLRMVEQEMADRFTVDDLLRIPSSPNYPRWEKTANWARQELAELGLVVRPSRHGIWEISDLGRSWLDEQLSRLL